MGDFYCRLCNVRRVEHDGDVCPSCQDPYQQAIPVRQDAPVQTGSDTHDAENEMPVMTHRSGRRIMGVPQRSGGQAGNAAAAQQAQEQQIQAQPPMSTGPIVAPAADDNEGHTAEKKGGKHAPQAEGVVRNIQESKDSTPPFSRWMRSFSYGVPFPMTDDMMEFQVFSGWNSGPNSATGYSADKIIVYGTINSGKPIQDNTVRVYGTRSKNNAIIAAQIENTTDGTYAEFNPPPLSAVIVRVVTWAVLAVVLFIVLSIFSAFSSAGASFNGAGLSAAMSGLLTNVAITALGAMGTLFCINQIKLAFRMHDWFKVFEYVFILAIALAVVSTYGRAIFGL